MGAILHVSRCAFSIDLLQGKNETATARHRRSGGVRGGVPAAPDKFMFSHNLPA
jgi:hypothetical protein